MTNWFKPRRFGYGATPTTWQGWLIIVAFPILLIIVALVLFVVYPAPSGGWAVARVAVFLLIDAVAVLGLIAFVRRKTEGAWRWRWGNRPAP